MRFSQEFDRRLLILGASNVSLGLPTIVRLVKGCMQGSVRLDVAHGHGRSYGMWTKVLGRELPGHLDGPLWKAIEPNSPHSALITDVGNDLLYGVEVAVVLEWVDQCVQRLSKAGTQTVLTGLPMASVASLSKLRFRIARTVLFPRSKLTLEKIREQSAELDRGLREIASRYHAKVLTPQQEWYGLDPIHIRRSRRLAAWTRILGEWAEWQSVATPTRGSIMGSFRIARLRPEQRRVRARVQHTPQPSLDQPGFQLRLY